MSKLSFRCNFRTRELQNLIIPIEIRKPNFALVARTLTTQIIELPPGTYTAIAQLPTGKELYKTFTTEEGKQDTIILGFDPEDEFPQDTSEVQYYLMGKKSPKLNNDDISTIDSHLPLLRFFSGNMLNEQFQLENPENISQNISFAMEERELLCYFSNDKPTLIQLIQPNHPPLNVPIPRERFGKHKFAIIYFDNRYFIDIRLENRDSDLLLRYQKEGMYSQASQLCNTNHPSLISDELLNGIVKDPISATVVAYSLLRFGSLDRLHVWTQNLCNDFIWLPDGLIIRAEYLARLGQYKESLQVLLDGENLNGQGLLQRGLPYFTDGLSIAINRLRQYSSWIKEDHEGFFTSNQVALARNLLGKLTPFVTYADLSEPILTFSGVNPTQPSDIKVFNLSEYVQSSISIRSPIKSEQPLLEFDAPKVIPILQIAWARFSELDANAIARSKSHLRKYRWIAALGVLVTLFAILSQMFPEGSEPALVALSLRIFLVATPIIASGMAAFTKAFYSSGDWLMLRAGAEEILKEIYFFRTVLQKQKDRRVYLEKRLAKIQRELYQSMGGELVLKPYHGPIPSNFYPDDPTSDPGFVDLSGEDYFKYRVENQLAWHRKEVQKYQMDRVKLTILILASGGVGAFLAALGGGFSIWVALTTSLTAAFLSWQEFRNIDLVTKNYRKVVMELSMVYDHWLNLEPEERSDTEFYRMVRGTEEVLWAQNMEYIKFQQEALKDADLEEEASLINRVIKESADSAKRTRKAMEDSMVEYTRETLEEAEAKVEETFKAALGSLAEEASSELVQQELEAMSKAIVEMAEDAMERASSLTSSLADIAKEFAHINIGRDTSKEELNAILARFPKTKDVKG